jgi:hypothetical protein
MTMKTLLTIFLVIMCVVANGAPAYAETRPVSIAESGRREVARLAAAEASRTVLPPNYPRSFAGPSPSSHFGRQIVAGTAGAVGGLFAGAWIGGAIANAGECRGEDCFLGGIMIGAPIGAIAGAIAGAVLAR